MYFNNMNLKAAFFYKLGGFFIGGIIVGGLISVTRSDYHQREHAKSMERWSAYHSAEDGATERAIEKGFAEYHPKTGEIVWLNANVQYIVANIVIEDKDRETNETNK